MTIPSYFWDHEQKRLESELAPIIGPASGRLSRLIILRVQPRAEKAYDLRKAADAWPEDMSDETRGKLTQLMARLKTTLRTALGEQAAGLLADLESMTPVEMLGLINDPMRWKRFREKLEDALRGRLQLSAQLGQEDASKELTDWARFNLPFEKAIAWARDHAAELVTDVDETTRGLLRDEITSALQTGVSPIKLRESIRSLLDESAEWRAARIAETEVMTAYREGSLQSYQESGVVWGEEWVSGQAGMCKVCQALHGQRVPLGESYRVTVSGKLYVISPGRQAHPHCRCRSKPITVAQALRLKLVENPNNPLANDDHYVEILMSLPEPMRTKLLGG